MYSERDETLLGDIKNKWIILCPTYNQAPHYKGGSMSDVRKIQKYLVV